MASSGARSEALEPAQFENLRIRVGRIALSVEKNFNPGMTFEMGDGVNEYASGHGDSYP